MSDVHLKTYTAGEDASRLAAMAKELGLQKHRQPRKQVRAATPELSLFTQIIQDSTMEDARMRSIFTSHTRVDEDGEDLLSRRALLDRMHSGWGDEEVIAEEDPHAAGLGGSLTSAILGIIKGMVGPAILYLPHGFAGAGYAVALPIMIGATIMYLYSSRCLLDTWKQESQKGAAAPVAAAEISTIGETTSLVIPKRRRRIILSYPELAYRALGSSGEAMVKTGIALMQSGVCLTYLIFVPQNLHSSMLTLTNIDVAPELWLILMIMIQIPLSWIRDIRKLTPTNLAANALILYGLLLCLGFSFSAAAHTAGMGPLESIGKRLVGLDPWNSEWFLFIGTSVLLFEGSITLLVPLQEAVVDERQRQAFPKVYERVILSIIVFYAFFGITCWMAFGNEVRTVLTTSLPDTILSTTVQLAYSIAVIFTFPLQNFPALEIACKSIGNLCSSSGTTTTHASCWKTNKRNIIASFLVIALALVAIATMDSLDKVVSLMGSLLGCPIAFIFPPLIHSSLIQDLSPGRKWANRIVVVLGFVSMVLASITTLIAW